MRFSRWTTRRASTMLVGVLALGGAAAGIAWAAIPSADGTINGCYQKSSGSLRVIDPGTQSCSTKEVPISWSQRGPQGAVGPAGAQGEQGEPGLPGVSGLEYVEGPNIAGGANEFKQTTVVCPSGKKAISGGFAHNTDNRVVLVASGPADTLLGTADHGWFVKVFIVNLPPYALSVRTFAVCISAS